MTSSTAASTSNPLDPHWVAYWARFRGDAHFLVQRGYHGASAQIQSDRHDEEQITGFISEKIEEFLYSTLDERFDHYAVKEDNPRPGEGRTGKKRRRIDIIVERTTRPRQKYTFEAKRLHQTTHKIEKYTGTEAKRLSQKVDGMLRFIEGTTYAAGDPEAAMIGYYQSDDENFWQQQLQTAFDSDSGNLMIIQTLDKSNGAPHSATWVSQHNRHGQPITLYHLLFDCICTS